jgi:hypothetical protein
LRFGGHGMDLCLSWQAWIWACDAALDTRPTDSILE